MSHMIPKGAHEREKLPAEKKFDGWVYGGISYLAQAVAGSALIYWIRHAGGKPHFEKAAKWFGENFISKVSSLRGDKAASAANSVIVVNVMIAMGTIFVIPVKLLENIKVSIVEKWTKQENESREATGNPLTAEEQAHQDKMMAELKAEPKQTWGSLMAGRFASLVPVYGALFALTKVNPIMEKGFQKFAKGTANALGMKKIANSEVLHNASGIAFLDGFYSMISASGLYIYSHFIAPPRDVVMDTPAPLPAAKTEPVEPEAASPETETHHQSRVAKGVGSYVEHVSAPSPSLQAAI